MPESLFLRIDNRANPSGLTTVNFNDIVTLAYPTMVLAQFAYELASDSTIDEFCVNSDMFATANLSSFSPGAVSTSALVIPVDVTRFFERSNPHLIQQTKSFIQQTQYFNLTDVMGVPLAPTASGKCPVQRLYLWFIYERA